MNRIRRLLLPVVATVLCTSLLAACSSSPPTNFYTLASGGTDTTAASSPRQTANVVAIGPVNLPDYLDRPQIVIRTSAYAMSLSSFDQWAGPLTDMLPRVLVEDMAQRSPSDRVVSFPEVSGPSFDYRIAVSINRFDVDTSGLATLVAHWQIYGQQGTQALLVTDDTLRQQATSSSYEAYVAALSATLGDLSDRMIAGLGVVRGAAPRPVALQ
ncbi:PqiC family protein [Defluviicoccus vanus]|uniref:Membrane integrity-associated transporter subunit PqiC n=1 Tax=Defluviicoccus vanus TaxID=111831 RepID=A0A7H1N2N7_9PROT|nr:PqiC family protein [Defluviicoccus vanus]QNT69973.1 membrane integrity-associated transporter subunit PqiC [Defluviicoccus vanus]